MSIAQTVIHAPAKVNLYLKITGKRDDGYHELDTVFFPLQRPYDLLRISQAESGLGLRLGCNLPGLEPEENIVFKAYHAFVQATDFAPDLHVSIEKNIPCGAGLGGGSSDAAALLRFLNTQAKAHALSPEKLHALATKLGADVPFFLLKSAARATGIGEKLDPINLDFKGKTFVLACPDEQVNTAWAYTTFDGYKNKDFGLTTQGTGNIEPISKLPLVFCNDFENLVFQEFPKIRAVKEELLRLGALGAGMSGSGASIFALFAHDIETDRIVQRLLSCGAKVYIQKY